MPWPRGTPGPGASRRSRARRTTPPRCSQRAKQPSSSARGRQPWPAPRATVRWDRSATTSAAPASRASPTGKAAGAPAALREAGVRVPEDMSLAGFDEIPVVRELSPPLTTVALPLAALGESVIAPVLRTASGAGVRGWCGSTARWCCGQHRCAAREVRPARPSGPVRDGGTPPGGRSGGRAPGRGT
ncbi:substrate-binding domain-containing protein [Streptomyces sp. NPDC088755]|uniref:substrate-binding domain-containing protein n=1 Tax=Streptomyces sp. NPDC088755 TaxID=3365888 RepID=UPI0037F34AFC